VTLGWPIWGRQGNAQGLKEEVDFKAEILESTALPHLGSAHG
jgi:hypothetical protein